jgi:hypothetical protein
MLEIVKSLVATPTQKNPPIDIPIRNHKRPGIIWFHGKRAATPHIYAVRYRKLMASWAGSNFCRQPDVSGSQTGVF